MTVITITGGGAPREIGERTQTKRAAAWAALSSVGLLLPSNLLRRLHQNPLRRDGKGSTDARNGIAVEIVVGVIA
jgi:hypothetical protein